MVTIAKSRSVLTDALHHRWYDSTVGKWLSEDPLGDLALVDANPYRYVHNSPPNATDPTGLKGSAASGRAGKPTEISVGSPFTGKYDDVWYLDVEVVNGKLRVWIRRGPGDAPPFRFEGIVQGSTADPDRDSAQVAVAWWQDAAAKIPCATGARITNARKQDPASMQAADWTLVKGTKRVNGIVDDSAYWETDIPKDANKVNIVLVWTDALNMKPKDHADTNRDTRAQGDAPLIIGSWSGSISKNGDWIFTINQADLTKSNLGTTGKEDYPTAQQISTIVSQSKTVVRSRTGYQLKERDFSATRDSDTGFDIVPR